MSELFHTRRAAGRAPSAQGARRARPPPRARAHRARRAAAAPRAGVLRARHRQRLGRGGGAGAARAAPAAARRDVAATRGVSARARSGAHAAARRGASASVCRAAYLTGVAWFAGVPLRVDARVLVPRSPLAELIERALCALDRPAARAAGARRGHRLGLYRDRLRPRAAARARRCGGDLRRGARGGARINVRRQRLARRVRLLKSDHFAPSAARPTISSWPIRLTWGAASCAGLPPEYRHEPRVALAAGRSGLDSVRVILRQARRHLRPARTADRRGGQHRAARCGAHCRGCPSCGCSSRAAAAECSCSRASNCGGVAAPRG